MRLLDRILGEGFSHHENVDDSDINIFKDFLNKSQLVVIDNVANYYFSQGLNDFFTASDFPCLMLPFETAFLEFRIPKSERKKLDIEEVGFILTMEDEKIRKDEFPNVFYQPEIKHFLTSYCFIRKINSDFPYLTAGYTLPIDKDGKIFTPNTNLHGVTKFFFPVEDNKFDSNMKFVHLILKPVFLAISFMNCQNVRILEEIPPIKLSKKNERKRGKPLLRYRILQIDHVKSLLKHPSYRHSAERSKKSLHICRGHFVTYGENGRGLLFGKLSGRYWIPMHVRGSSKEGIVIKDYNVK